MSSNPTNRAIEAVWRIESARLIAALTRWTGDLGAAEDLASAALVAALEQWPGRGIPDRPGAWLMAAAKRRAVDGWRHDQLVARKHQEHPELSPAEAAEPPDLAAALDEDLGDDLLRLVFIACHPLLSPEARVALTLRVVCGLSTAEIARATLAAEPTVAQRIVRAKRALAEAGVPFELPSPEERAARLDAVLEVVYLVFNEGYLATAGASLTRRELVEEALRLGRVLAARCPEDGAVLGLLALMELQASRLAARVGPGGVALRLEDQDRARWDRLQISRGLAALEQAFRTGARPGSYTLQAAIAACHTRARSPAETDWARISHLYRLLALVDPSPIVELNRAVAVSRAHGAEAGLALLDALADEPSLATYAPLHAVRGDLLERLGRPDEAATCFERAAALTRNEAEAALLAGRAEAARRATLGAHPRG